MKNLIFILLASCITIQMTAQSKDIEKGKDLLREYQQNGKLEDLTKAYNMLKTAMQNESNQKDANALFYYGYATKVYMEASKATPRLDYMLASHQALRKALDLKKDHLEKEQIHKLLVYLTFDLYQEGITLHDERKTQEAYTAYKELVGLYAFLQNNNVPITAKDITGKEIGLKSTDIMNNYVVFSMNADKKSEVKTAMIELIKTDPSGTRYAQMVQLLGQIGENIERERYLEAGRKAYPQDLDLLIADVNLQIDKKNNPAAIKLIEDALKIQDTNTQLYLTLGQLYENVNEDIKAMEVYQRGLTKYPTQPDFNYQIARTYYNQGVAMYNKPDQVSQKQAKERFMNAKKYFLAAKNLKSSATDIDKILTQIDQIQ